jgi:ketosteroid isomerase-like protein
VTDSPLDIVARFNKAWAAGDIDAAMAVVGEDAVYRLHLSNDVLPFGGVTEGKTALEATLRKVREDFDYILYRPMSLNADGETVRFQVEFMYRHRASGQTLEGRFRHVMTVREGRIVCTEEYHDRAKVEAFMRMFGRPSA